LRKNTRKREMLRGIMAGRVLLAGRVTRNCGLPFPAAAGVQIANAIVDERADA
jgi:hypothetical protein